MNILHTTGQCSREQLLCRQFYIATDFLLQKFEAVMEGKEFNPTIRTGPDGRNTGEVSNEGLKRCSQIPKMFEVRNRS